MEFDPYTQWLQIPADRRPPSYYDLLGLPAFESDASRIRQCVMQRTEQVRRYQLGQHSQAAIALLSELSRAFDTLTTPDRKQQYDRRLAEMETAGDEPAAPPGQTPTSPFQPGYVPAPAELQTPPRQGRFLALAKFLLRVPRFVLIASVSIIVFTAKASWWTLRMSDRAMCKSLGEENAILHNFVRVVVSLCVLFGLAVVPPLWPSIAGQLKIDATTPPFKIANVLSESEAALPAEDPLPPPEPPLTTIPTIVPPPMPETPTTPPVAAPRVVRTMENSLGMLLTSIAPGRFSMGSPVNETGRTGTEDLHTVEISKEFYLGAHEVTQAQFEQVMGANPSHFTTEKRGAALAGVDVSRLPVDSVLWSEAVEYCRRLSARPEEQAAGRSYRLPTEAEWEYACRAGTITAYSCGERMSSSGANFRSAGLPVSSLRPMAVGLYPANAFGLFDMHGNVEEWCADYYDYTYYRMSPTADPRGPGSGLNRVARGGSFRDAAEACRSARRESRSESRLTMPGFRVACDVSKLNP